LTKILKSWRSTTTSGRLGEMVGEPSTGSSRAGQVWLDRGSLSSEPSVLLIVATTTVGSSLFHRLVRLTDGWEHEWYEERVGALEAGRSPLIERLF